MSKMVYAKDITALSVDELMRGRKTKVAVKDGNGNFHIKTKSIITQYLNPNKERTKMTQKIADALCSNFEYYIRETKDNESFDLMCGKALLFIYSVSGIDMTYILQKNYDDSGKEKITKSLIDTVSLIFQSFVGKEGIKYSELEEIVYTRKFGMFLKDNNVIDDISSPKYMNYNFFQSFVGEEDIKCFELEKIVYTSDFDLLLKDNNDIIDISLDKYLSCILNLYDGKHSYYNDIGNRLGYLLELITTQDIEMFDKKHGKVKQILTRGEITGENWKENYFSNKFGLPSLFETNYIEKTNHLSEKIVLQYYKNVIDSKINAKNTKENKILVESDIFKRFMGGVENYINFLRLQARVDKEIVTFGYFNTYKKVITEPLKLIKEMMDFLFYGVYAKVGRVDENDDLTEVWRDYISKYISGEQKKFTDAVKDAIYNRIKYNLQNNEYFESLLWQFMYYAFSIDFYMINKKEDWLSLVEKILKDVMRNKTMPDIKEHMQLIFDQKQFKRLLEHKRIKFIPNDIKFFRMLENEGVNLYTDTLQNVLSSENEFPNMRIIITIKYIKLKVSTLMKKFVTTIELAEELLKKKSPQEITEYRLLLGEEKENWKENFLYNKCDENAQRISISLDELEELSAWVAALIIGCRINGESCNKKHEFMICAKRIADMRDVILESIDKSYDRLLKDESEKHFNELNKELWKSEIVQNMYKFINKCLGFIVYSEYVDENIRFL